MTSKELLQRAPAVRILERAARAAGTPLAVHRVERTEEGPAEVAMGGCDVCAYVSRIEGGVRACRQSRLVVSGMALRQRRALAFTCHLGFACVSAPMLVGEDYVLTFGPFCPEGEGLALAEDVGRGLRALGAGHVVPPLDDLPTATLDAVTAIAEWTHETLEQLWQGTISATEAPEEEGTPDAAPVARPRTARHADDPYDGAAVAAAAAGGNQPQVRDLLRGVLDEASRRSVTGLEERRARLAASVSASLEALARVGLAETAWGRFPDFLGALRTAPDDRALLDAAMLVLGAVRRSAKPRAGAPERPSAAKVGAIFPRLNEILTRRIDAPLTLGEVARELGETPSAISHRLKKKFGMSFSEYRGRLRIDKAKELLRRTRLSATEVARRVGIADQSNFGKLFKKFEGLSPLEYRRQHGKN